MGILVFFKLPMETVQTFGRKREAVAVAFVKKGKGLIKVNGVPIELVQPEGLRFKVWEPVLLLGANRYREVDIRIRVKGGGYTSQLYAIRQAIAKALVAWYQKYVDEASKREIKEILMSYDRTPCCRPPSSGAQEVRWPWCPRSFPEVLPLNGGFSASAFFITKC